MGSFWNCEKLRFEDLPTVAGLLFEADEDRLTSEILDMLFTCGEPFDTPDAKRKRKEIRKAFKQMRLCSIAPRSGKWVFMPLEVYDYDRLDGKFYWSTEAALLKRKDLYDLADIAQRAEASAVGFDARGTAHHVKLAEPQDDLPHLHDWGLRSWEKVLSYRVWMHGGYSRKERYRTLASVFLVMMECGYDAKEVKDEQRLIKKEMKRSKKLRKKDSTEHAPIELISRKYGLEANTDNYKEEFENRANETLCMLNNNARIDLARRAADLVDRMGRAEEEGRKFGASVYDFPF